jgi:hypothetical protein
MRQVVLMMLLGAASGTAAAEWVKVAESEFFIAYADPATIRRAGDMAKMWSLLDYKTPRLSVERRVYMSSRVQDEYDCKQERTRILSFSFRSRSMGRGKMVDSDFDAGKWRPVASDAVDESLWKFACGKH